MSFSEKLGKKLDYLKVGIIVSILLPIIVFILLWQFQYGEKGLAEIFRFMSRNSMQQNDLLIFSLLPNLLLFYFTNFQWRWDKFTTGLVAVTIILTIPVAVLIIW